jgi:hypothetical protein
MTLIARRTARRARLQDNTSWALKMNGSILAVAATALFLPACTGENSGSVQDAEGETTVRYVICGAGETNCFVAARFKDFDGCESHKRWSEMLCDSKSQPEKLICEKDNGTQMHFRTARTSGERMSITELMQQLVKARAQLETHGVRDSGQYAELLVCSALNAQRNRSGVQKGFDIRCTANGRVEVRSRTLPSDGRNETRLEIPKKKVGHFDCFAGILFNSDISVLAGFLLPHDAAVALAGKQKFLRIPFEIGARHPEARDITKLLRDAQSRL